MGRGRAQVTVRDNRTALCQVDVGQGSVIATRTRGSGGQPKQKIGKGEEQQRSIRRVRTVQQLIAEDLGANTKIVAASRQRDRVRHIEIVVRRLILVVDRIAESEERPVSGCAASFALADRSRG